MSKKVVWHLVIKIVQDNQYYRTYTILFSDRSCVLLKQMCWFWHDFTWNQLHLSLSNIQSWWNIPCLSFLPLVFFTDSIGISAKFMKVVCSVNAYEPLTLEIKTSQSSLSFQELQTLVCEKPETWQIQQYSLERAN